MNVDANGMSKEARHLSLGMADHQTLHDRNTTWFETEFHEIQK